MPLAIAAPTSSKCGDVPPAQAGSRHKLVGEALPAWKPGEFQVHFIYTGVCESMFWILPDGTRLNVEAELAKELDPVDVAKVNHHGHHSMPTELVAALRARVWTACVWDQLHMTADTLEHLSDRTAYPGPRLIAPGVFSPLRRFEDAGRDYLRDIAPESFDAGHVVLNVAPGGRTYSIIYVTADDESMRVTGAYDFA